MAAAATAKLLKRIGAGETVSGKGSVAGSTVRVAIHATPPVYYFLGVGAGETVGGGTSGAGGTV